MLAQVLRRLRICSSLDEIAVATTAGSSDDAIADVCRSEEVAVYRGSEHDVLSRFVLAARETHADVVVRVTADCPLLDPTVTDRVVDALTLDPSGADYASNVIRRTFPRGLDVEALFVDALVRVDRLAKSALEREHVTIAIRSERSELFLTRSVEADQDDSDLRWTVDEEEDLDLVRALYNELGLADIILPYRSVVEYVRAHPELARLNDHLTTWTPAGTSSSKGAE